MPSTSPHDIPLPAWMPYSPAPCESLTTNQTNRDVYAHAAIPLTAQLSVTVYVYNATQHYWKYTGRLTDGLYSLANEKKVRPQLGFPHTRYSIYDPAVRRFVHLPTFSHIEVRAGQFLILRDDELSDKPYTECPGMSDLIRRANCWYTQTVKHLYTSAKKRRASVVPLSLPSGGDGQSTAKRRRTRS